MYHGWIIEDIQEEAREFYADPLYPEWESTKNYVDTGEQLPLVSDLQEQQEQQSPSDESDDEDEAVDSDVEGEDDLLRGGNMSPSARQVVIATLLYPRPPFMYAPPFP